MKTIYYATSNKDKVRVAQNSLGSKRYKVEQLEIEIPEIQSLDTAEVAKRSAKLAAEKTRKWVIKNDCGLHMETLGGLPGALLKYFNQCLTEEGFINLYKDSSNHRAYFSDALAFCRPGEEPVCFTHKTFGTLIDMPRGESKYVCDRLFIPDGYQKTIAELSESEWLDLWDNSRFQRLVCYLEQLE